MWCLFKKKKNFFFLLQNCSTYQTMLETSRHASVKPTLPTYRWVVCVFLLLVCVYYLLIIVLI